MSTRNGAEMLLNRKNRIIIWLALMSFSSMGNGVAAKPTYQYVEKLGTVNQSLENDINNNDLVDVKQLPPGKNFKENPLRFADDLFLSLPNDTKLKLYEEFYGAKTDDGGIKSQFNYIETVNKLLLQHYQINFEEAEFVKLIKCTSFNSDFFPIILHGMHQSFYDDVVNSKLTQSDINQVEYWNQFSIYDLYLSRLIGTCAIIN